MNKPRMREEKEKQKQKQKQNKNFTEEKIQIQTILNDSRVTATTSFLGVSWQASSNDEQIPVERRNNAWMKEKRPQVSWRQGRWGRIGQTRQASKQERKKERKAVVQ
jgi:hypothetical protein